MESPFNIFLKKEKESRTIEDFLEPANPEDVAKFKDFIGEEAYKTALDFGASFYKKRENSFKDYEGVYEKNKGNNPDIELFVRHNGRVVVLYGSEGVEETNPDYKDIPVFSKILYFHFLFEEDFIKAASSKKNILGKDNYLTVRDELDGRGLTTEALSFFRDIKKLLTMMKKDVLVDVDPSDEKRERFYKLAFKNNSNIRVNKAD